VWTDDYVEFDGTDDKWFIATNHVPPGEHSVFLLYQVYKAVGSGERYYYLGAYNGGAQYEQLEVRRANGQADTTYTVSIKDEGTTTSTLTPSGLTTGQWWMIGYTFATNNNRSWKNDVLVGTDNTVTYELEGGAPIGIYQTFGYNYPAYRLRFAIVYDEAISAENVTNLWEYVQP